MAWEEAYVSSVAGALGCAARFGHVECVGMMLEKTMEGGGEGGERVKEVMEGSRRAATCWHGDSIEVILRYVSGLEVINLLEDGVCLGLSNALTGTAGYFDCDDRCGWGKTSGEQILVMQKLIAAGADLNLGYAHEGEGAFWAAYSDDYLYSDIVCLLLDHGLDLTKSSGFDGQTTFFGMVSVCNHNVSLVEAFLEKGAIVTVRDENGNTPLHVAAQRSFAELLFEHGADVSARNAEGMTPLHAACEDGRV